MIPVKAPLSIQSLEKQIGKEQDVESNRIMFQFVLGRGRAPRSEASFCAKLLSLISTTLRRFFFLFIVVKKGTIPQVRTRIPLEQPLVF